MSDETTQDTSELTSFVRETIESIENGMKKTNYMLKGDITFELAVANTKQVGGGFKLLIADIGGKYENEKLSKMKFAVGQRRSPPVIASASFDSNV